MFALPNAKRVRRDELYADSNAGSTSPSPGPDNDSDAAAALFRHRMAGLLDLGLDNDEQQLDSATPALATDDTTRADDEADAEAGFEFNLFAPTATPQADQTDEHTSDTHEQNGRTNEETASRKPDKRTPRPRIRLTPPPGLDAAGYPTDYKHTPQIRPQSYYFTSASSASVTAEQQRRFKLAAIDAPTLLKRAATPWPDGHILDAHRPWRVSVWLPSKSSSSQTPGQYILAEDAQATKKRVRAGKKTRIKRRKLAAKTALKTAEKQRRQAEEAQREADKEEHIRRKKSELNRKKQIRKREKERERKAAEGENGGLASTVTEQ